MAELTHHLMNPARGIAKLAATLREPARRYLYAAALLALAPLCQAQVPADVQLPNYPPNVWSVGSTIAATNSITAPGAGYNQVVVDGAARG